MNEIPLDQIHIRDLMVRCIIGVDAEERREKQDVTINITLYADLRRSGLTDRIEDTVNYRTVKKRVLAMVEESRFLLVERLAEKIAEICLDDPLVKRARVVVEKPGALRLVVRVDYHAGKKPLGFIELLRTRASDDKVEYFVRTEHTRWHAQVFRVLARQLEQDVDSVLK